MANRVLDELQPELHTPHHPGTRFRGLVIATGSFASGFVLAGFGEQWGLIQIIVLLLLSIVLRNRLIWLALLGSLLGYGVVALAPGNVVRSAALEAIKAPRRTFLEAIEYSFYRNGMFIQQTINSKLYAVLIALCAGYMAGQGRQLRHRLLWFIGVVVGSYLLIAISLFPVAYVSGGFQHRHFTVATFIFIAGIASIGYIAACRKSFLS
jgi:hypothetical protein